MKRIILVGILVFTLVTVLVMGFTGCEDQASIVNYNITKEADNFNMVRQLTVINEFTNDITFQMTGKMSITADTLDKQLEIIVELPDETYKKHFVGLGDNTSYIIEDISGADVSQYDYTLNYNPKMWLPYEIGTID